MHVPNLSGDTIKLRLLAEPVDAETCFSIIIDPENPQLVTPCLIVEDVQDTTGEVKNDKGAFTQIQFQKADGNYKKSVSYT